MSIVVVVAHSKSHEQSYLSVSLFLTQLNLIKTLTNKAKTLKGLKQRPAAAFLIVS